MKRGALALPRRIPLAVVARDASNPSTGLFAKQQVSGILESNQKPQSYQLCALTNCANARYCGFTATY